MPQVQIRKVPASQADQPAQLNSFCKTRIAPSKIHGVGLFALRDIDKGQKLYADIVPYVFTLPYSSFNKLFPEVRQLLLERFPLVTRGSAFVFPDTRLQAYINHSFDPNYDCVNDVLLKDVKKGEEITEDYRLIESWEEVHGHWLKKLCTPKPAELDKKKKLPVV